MGYYLTPDNILELSYVAGKWDLFHEKHSFTSLRLKTFWGNSFYTNFGLAYRSDPYTYYNYNENSLSGGVSIRENVLGVDFAIGNRWQWDYFTIGCDWIGLFSPIPETATTKLLDDNGESAEYVQAALDDYDFGKTGSIELLRFFIGISF